MKMKLDIQIEIERERQREIEIEKEMEIEIEIEVETEIEIETDLEVENILQKRQDNEKQLNGHLNKDDQGNGMVKVLQITIDSGCIEQAYYRLEAQMRQLGERFGIPQTQQKIFVGSLGEALHALEQAEPVDLLVLGNHREGERLVMPVDALSATLRSTHSDVLVVR